MWRYLMYATTFCYNLGKISTFKASKAVSTKLSTIRCFLSTAVEVQWTQVTQAAFSLSPRATWGWNHQ